MDEPRGHYAKLNEPGTEGQIQLINPLLWEIWNSKTHRNREYKDSSIQSLSRIRLFATPWCSTSGIPVHLQLPCPSSWSSHLIQPSHLLSPSPPAPNPSQHQGCFQWVNYSHKVGKVLEFQLLHQSFQWTPRTDLLLRWTGWISVQSKGLLRVFSNTIVQKHQYFGAQFSSQSNSYVDTWQLEKP